MATEDVGMSVRGAGGTSPLRPADLGIGQLFSVVGDAVIVGDASTGRVVLWNPSAERLLGYTAEEAVGMPIEVLVPQPLKGRHRDGLARFAGTGETSLVGSGRAVEVPAQTKSGDELWVQLTLSPVDASQVQGRFVLALVRDVTERRRAQAQLAAYADQLEAANRAMRDFLLVAAHDLRTPLSSIRAAGELVASPRLPAAEVVDLGEVIVRQADNLGALIAELVELGQIEAGETRANPVSLLLGPVVAEAQEAAGPGGVEVSVEVDADLCVWADHGHLRRILMNYLTNAHHYAGSGISLTARSAADSVEICVADTGPGVRPEFVARLFDKFSRGTEVRQAAGMGLGLAIVAALAKLNGGVAWYEPNAPTGAQFWVRLPAPS